MPILYTVYLFEQLVHISWWITKQLNISTTLDYNDIFKGAMVQSPPPPNLTVNFLDNFCTLFVSFVSQLNCTIRVPKLLVTVRVFCLLKTASQCTQTYHFRLRFETVYLITCNTTFRQ